MVSLILLKKPTRIRFSMCVSSFFFFCYVSYSPYLADAIIPSMCSFSMDPFVRASTIRPMHDHWVKQGKRRRKYLSDIFYPFRLCVQLLHYLFICSLSLSSISHAFFFLNIFSLCILTHKWHQSQTHAMCEHFYT